MVQISVDDPPSYNIEQPKPGEIPKRLHTEGFYPRYLT